MNCDLCGEKFSKLTDLKLHAISERHSYFNCIPCAMAVPGVTDVEEHIASKEHLVMTLATGVKIDADDNSLEDFNGSFPPYRCCLICSVRGGGSHEYHLASDIHKYNGWLLRSILRSKKIYYNDTKASPNTQMLISKLINAKRNKFLVGAGGDNHDFGGSLAFNCELCNLHFNNQECLDEHLNDQSHTRMEQFLAILSQLLNEINIVGHRFCRKSFSNSLVPFYYCEVCCLWINTIFNYIQHRKSNKHLRQFKLIQRQSRKMKFVDIKPHGVVSANDKRSYTEAESDVSDSRNQNTRTSKRLKISPPSPKHHYVIHRKREIDKPVMDKIVQLKKKRRHCCCSHKIIGNPSSSLDNEDEDNKMTYPKFNFEVSENAENSSARIGREARNFSLELVRKVKETARNNSTRLDSEISVKNSTACMEHKVGLNAIYSTRVKSGITASRNYISRLDSDINHNATLKPRSGIAGDSSLHLVNDGGCAQNSTSRIDFQVSGETSRVYEDWKTTVNSIQEDEIEDGEVLENSNEDIEADEEQVLDNSNEDIEDNQEHYCELCDYFTYNPQHYEKHLTGDQHKRMRRLINKKEKKLDTEKHGCETTSSSSSHPLQYNCELCSIFNRSYQEYEYHLDSSTHKKNQWLLFVLKQGPI